MSELDIPDRALVSAARAYNVLDPSAEHLTNRINVAIVTAAPIIVAAELIERADAIDARALKAKPGASVPLAQEAARLRRRADELDPSVGNR